MFPFESEKRLRVSPCDAASFSLLSSERGGGAAGVLADEADQRGRPAERRPGRLRNGSLQQSPVRLLRQPPRWQLLWKFPGTSSGWLL